MIHTVAIVVLSFPDSVIGDYVKQLVNEKVIIPDIEGSWSCCQGMVVKIHRFQSVEILLS
jgi:hypothetical protein